eukprot:Plantae.Rhodophyta-Rhodochaete_pulchella.ctg16488.p1 GENE.Plantae.Rhodophyta-Rhodochaete_pulchella.ctg16488~~Plantae.Rhodophyta-Rhodochaete_pulchella.ctg16488.p1  ORF type:complete len:347 (+),score=27.99 Plantae.Rhodophyta-Rhodochaete_pulchella.ctg16488:62-1102(+)
MNVTVGSEALRSVSSKVVGFQWAPQLGFRSRPTCAAVHKARLPGGHGKAAQTPKWRAAAKIAESERVLERDLADLLQRNQPAIEHLRNLCNPLVNPEREHVLFSAFWGFDDVCLLCYLLTHGEAEHAASVVEEAVAFRRANLDWLEPAINGKGIEYAPCFEAFARTIGLAEFDKDNRTVDGDSLLFLIRSGQSNFRAAFREMTVTDVANFLTFANELLYRGCHEDTCERGRLTKVTLVNALTGFKLQNYDRRFAKAYSLTSQQSKILHPQLLRKQVFFDPPRFFKGLWTLVKPVLPRSLVRSTGLCPCPKGPYRGDIATCPFAAENLEPTKLPRYLGGSRDELTVP